MDRLLSFMARALSLACPGSSATRFLITAVDLGLSPFSVQAGHEVSLCQAWVSMRTTWEIKGGGWLMMDSEANLKAIRRRATLGRLIRAGLGASGIRNSVCVLTGCWSLGMLAASRVSAGMDVSPNRSLSTSRCPHDGTCGGTGAAGTGTALRR
ncbi:hypothetical protein F5882DRAFT_157065 [Hyaloscypha sp. PMI_1271]|nr:hypothetical protein F5882DRAFT_157065 [Hyaloscypha sp. PMI_1271]